MTERTRRESRERGEEWWSNACNRPFADSDTISRDIAGKFGEAARR